MREVHDKGLAYDLPVMSRRRMPTAIGGAGALAAAGGALLGGTAEPATAACAAEVDSEAAGPYPADGSNGPNVRALSGIVRNGIRSSFGASTTTAPGVPLRFSLTALNAARTPTVGAAVYAWHCDRAGRYSLHSSGVTAQNYLRGIQVTTRPAR
ncbi:hypothetical protein QLQ12_01610 [Actinoplanes sp. NEAU-A12]|uniref:Intradiol ring-cleavage dioxygenases domain-containing protein n=1 Tax=Actinoplanes sandaracinus TaxID=3045177 RepID=A0ABT6WC80_9ACTN|nr:hypothetical protein [Actinoplanes sandaracinus]MDI6097306.1 hypothetical protein [Actinoplanes sandaracinus]